jgi:hypothetical protein
MDAREKAKKLIKLAVHEKTPDKERFAAALAAVKIIDRASLLDEDTNAGPSITPDDLQASVTAVQTLFAALTDPSVLAAAKRLARTIGRRAR